MLVLILAYLGGVLTIVSPCILPVLPFVFARADRPFARNGLPMLIGMALTFAAVATLAAVGGHWVVQLNTWGRWMAMAVLALVGLALLLPRFSDWLARPFVALGGRLSMRADAGDSAWAALGLGVATGLLWAPCAGPILGLILTAAALKGASVGTTLLLVAFAAGAATSLALALLLGGRVFAAMQRSLGWGEQLRRVLGALVLLGVAAIALGLDTGLLTRLSLASTAKLEQRLVDVVSPSRSAPSPAPREGVPLPVEGWLPRLDGATGWFNGPPLTREGLRGKVVLVDFWTYSCINCLRTLPYLRGWADKYRDHGLVVLGVHTPEFAFEKDPGNVAEAIETLGIGYPVALDNDYAIWRAFENRYWPAHYFVDAQGRIRYHHFGEGEYARSEDVIRRLLAEAGATDLPGGYVGNRAAGAEAPPSRDWRRTPETYLGHARAERFANNALAKGVAWDYPRVAQLAPDQWALEGRWTVQPEFARAERAGASITLRFRARDLHLVLAPAEDGTPVRFRITLDGQPPGADAGSDIDAAGNGTIDGERLYQLVRQRRGSRERLFEISFLDPGARAYAFTSG
ncbi:cytochrome c biogenesis protein DipZ [Cognatiluteimonas lumbrici]|uniref:cytochrome c biogenesis protein DipZ n=1 Tax=Cognatiluteimonas lumbrici TaxID=2559601 RepID=UPI00112A02E2|nr:cytochrome c biogenesis protein DipZ [Luteimonas lumbrici]